MRSKLLITLFVIATGTGINCYAQTANVDAEKAKVKLVVDEFKQFWETENMDLFSKILAHDTGMVNYGTDANEIFVGWDALRDSVQKILPAIEKTKITVKNQVINVNPRGNFAWFSEVWNWSMIFGGQPVQVPNQRLTGVLEKRNGSWVIVQFHNSVPVTQ